MTSPNAAMPIQVTTCNANNLNNSGHADVYTYIIQCHCQVLELRDYIITIGNKQ